jgi:hypothetical protein
MRSNSKTHRVSGKRLTIVGGVRDALAAWRLGRCEIVRPRRHRALLCGPSTSPLGVVLAASRASLAPLVYPTPYGRCGRVAVLPGMPG